MYYVVQKTELHNASMSKWVN